MVRATIYACKYLVKHYSQIDAHLAMLWRHYRVRYMTSYNEHDNDVIAWPNGHQFVNSAAQDFTHVYLYVAGIPGSQGLDGVPGLEGHRGVPGSKGIHGNRGPDGLHGTQGLTVRHLEEYTNPG